MRQEINIREQLKRFGISLAERIGQHILVDKETLELLNQQVISGASVIEIGPGPGNLTAKLAQRASRVVGIEIDRKFKPALDELQAKSKNVEIVYRDALSVDLQKYMAEDKSAGEWQVVANPPFHLSEPLLKKIAGLPIENAVLVVGDRLARTMQRDDPADPEFTRTSLLSKGFFHVQPLAKIDKDSFYPPSHTRAAVVALTPKGKVESKSNPGLSILRKLFLTEHQNPTVARVIKEAASEQRGGSHKSDRQKVKQKLRQYVRRGGLPEEDKRPGRPLITDRLDLPDRILSTPFSRLDNQDIRTLAKALKERFG